MKPKFYIIYTHIDIPPPSHRRALFLFRAKTMKNYPLFFILLQLLASSGSINYVRRRSNFSTLPLILHNRNDFSNSTSGWGCMSCRRSKITRTTRTAADEQQEKLRVAHVAVATCPRLPTTRDTFFNAIQIGSRTHIASSGIISSAVLFAGPIRAWFLVVDLLN